MESERGSGGLLRPVPSLNSICGRIRDVRSSLEVSVAVADGGMVEELNVVIFKRAAGSFLFVMFVIEESFTRGVSKCRR